LHSWTLAAWMSPTLIALILAAPISKAAGSLRLGEMLQRARILATPQELAPPPIARDAERLRVRFPAAPGDALISLAADPELFRAHRKALDTAPRGRGAVDAETALATVKLSEAQSLEEVAQWLEPAERMRILSDTNLLDRVESLRRRKADPAAQT
ncbi:MAG: glucan biosynthesis glucosyltransferase H, partial [Pseudomonadota bacterium]